MIFNPQRACTRVIVLSFVCVDGWMSLTVLRDSTVTTNRYQSIASDVLFVQKSETLQISSFAEKRLV